MPSPVPVSTLAPFPNHLARCAQCAARYGIRVHYRGPACAEVTGAVCSWGAAVARTDERGRREHQPKASRRVGRDMLKPEQRREGAFAQLGRRHSRER
jgi:hypothetical protein